MKQFLMIFITGLLLFSCVSTNDQVVTDKQIITEKEESDDTSKEDSSPSLQIDDVDYSIPVTFLALKETDWKPDVVPFHGAFDSGFSVGKLETDVNIKIGDKTLSIEKGTEITYKNAGRRIAVVVLLKSSLETTLGEDQVVFKKDTMIYLDHNQIHGTAGRKLVLHSHEREITCSEDSLFAYSRNILIGLFLKTPGGIETKSSAFECSGHINVKPYGTDLSFNTLKQITFRSGDTVINLPGGSQIQMDGDHVDSILVLEKTDMTVGGKKMTVDSGMLIIFDENGNFKKQIQAK